MPVRWVRPEPSIIRGFFKNSVARTRQSRRFSRGWLPRPLSLRRCTGELHPRENPVLSSLAGRFPPAILALSDGSVFVGQSIGSPGLSVGTLRFNTAMTGYQEVMTDAASHGQIISFSCPHIGNCGVNPEDRQSARIQAAGVVLRDLPLRHSNFRASQSLSDWLQAEGAVGVAGVDTRQITRLLRDGGPQQAAILALDSQTEASAADIERARAAAAGATSASTDACTVLDAVAGQQATPWDQGGWTLAGDASPAPAGPKILAWDLGGRYSDWQLLVERGCRLELLPLSVSLSQALERQPDGLVLAGGPDAAATCDPAQALARELLASGRPVLGLGLGHLLLAAAAGAQCSSLPVGHHGANHPVRDLASGRVNITAQASELTVEADSLPAEVQVSHSSLFDGSVKGLQWTERPVLGFAGWAAAVGGPHESGQVVDRFLGLVAQARQGG